MQSADTLIHARWIIPVEPPGTVHEHFCLVIRDGRIVALAPSIDVRAGYRAASTVELYDHVLIPGLINAHTHAAMSLLRGLADDLPLMKWLKDHIWPSEVDWVSSEFVRDGTLLAAVEMLRGGVTLFNDMYFFPDVAAEAALSAGIRAMVGLIVVDFPTVWAATAQEYISKGLDVHDRFRGDPFIRTAFAPHAPYTVSDQPLNKVRMLADELDIPIHMHVHETRDEVDQGLANNGMRPLARMQKLGVLSPRLLAVHMTQLTDEEIAYVAATGAHVVHCPESNLKLASGFCPVQRLLSNGINVALGTDGAASNNDLDMFGEMRTAALLGKAVAGDASSVPARQVLRMATLNGARALGVDDELGSLEPGKAADITAVCLGGIESQPVYDPVSVLVYATGRDKVTDVWVAGRHVLKDRVLTTVDIAALEQKARAWGARIGAKDHARAVQ